MKKVLQFIFSIEVIPHGVINLACWLLQF